MKKLSSIFATVILFFGFANLSAEVEYKSGTFNLSPALDISIASTGVALFATDIILEDVLHLNQPSLTDFDFSNKNKIPELDALFMRPYSKALNYTAWGTLALVGVSPAMFAVLPSGEWLTIGVMYAESVLLAESLKRLGKFAVNRARPYMYFENYPQDKVDDGDWAKSWPSGHTTLAFTAASFASYLFCQYFPESSYKWAVVGGTYAVAAATGVLRMCSGNHFFSDVLTGAVLGTATGLLIPWMHTKDFKPFGNKNNNSEVAVSPLGFSVTFKI